ncbi:MAG: radical SAM protein [Armatimonadetes bacterium]|nr:radical SAM protein [Armatimonadota bacterium]
MAAQTFDMLTAVIPDGLGGRASFCGFLAEQDVDLTRKHPWLLRLGAAAARLTRRPRVQLLGFELQAERGPQKVVGRTTGLLAPLFGGKLARMVERINAYGRPIAARDDGFVYTLYQPPVPSTRMVNHLSRVLVQGREPARPTTCTLQVTTRCQLDCYHCSAARYKSRERAELSTEEWIGAIRQAERLGVNNIVLTGGEPLLRDDLYDLVAAIDPSRANAAMFTNGLLLTDERVTRLREAGLFSLMVSLDDVRPENHDQLRRIPGGFQKAVDGIKRALDGGLLVGISTYAGPEDVREGRAGEMIEFTREIGAHEITIFDTVPTGKLLPLEHEALLSEADKQQLIDLGHEYNAKDGYPHVITQAFINGPDGAGCFAGYIQFYMTAFGDVNPCDFTPLTFGNIRDDTLQSIWERLLAHPAYCRRSDHCRMQDAEFRRKYIDDIPEDVLLPWPGAEEVREQPHCPQKCGAGHASCAG